MARIKQGLVEARATPAVIGRTVAPRLVPGGVPIVAVLPLLASSDDGMAGWIAGGVAEDLVGMLASLREPMVISANSTRHLTGHNLDLRTIAAQLGAHYVVTGSVRVAGGRGRIAVELAEASNGAALWGQAFTFTEDSIFETQAVIAANIANALAPQVNAAELRRSKGQLPDDMGAYHLLLQARDRIFRLDREGFDEAGGMLAEAVRRDPGYSGAHAARADWFSLRVFQGWSADIGRDVAALMDAAQEAIRLDPLNARALALYAHNLMLAHGRNDDALALLDRSLAAAPNDAEALIWSGPTLAYSDHTTQAIDRCERALLLSPSDPFLFRYQHFMSIAHYCAGNFSQSAAFGLRAHTENPNYISNLKVTIAALCGAGRTHEIPNLMRCLLKLQPDFSVNAMLARKLFHDDTKQARMRRDLLSVGLPP